MQNLSTLGSLGNLNNTGLQALSRVQPPLTPSLTPSLANHYREDLTQHVRAFPADILEKQVYNLKIVNYVFSKSHHIVMRISNDMQYLNNCYF